MNRTRYFHAFSRVAGLGIAAAFVCGMAATLVAASKPNILFILSDDQRWDTIRALGNPDIETPHLDRLVQRGFRFNNAYCMGSMHGAVCLPSRTMLATGRSLWNLPTVPRSQATPPPEVSLLPTLLNEAGYVTFHCGKANNACTYGNAAFAINIATEGRTTNSATEHADQTIQFLKHHDGTKPFFVYLAPPVPHDPRLAPVQFSKLYDPAKLTLSKNFMPDHPFDNGELHVRDEELAPHPRTPEVMRRHLADYYATISHLDHEVGRVLETLSQRGFSDNTIIIFSSDQGLAVGGRHGLMGKQNLYEHVKPPLIFAGSGVPHGQSDALVYLFDLFPTLCDLGGARTPDAAEGESLLPVIQGTRAKVRDTLFGAYRDCQRMIRDERWKLIKYNARGMKSVQLFDLKNDPDELHNLSTDSRQANQLARLERQLVLARKAFGDPVDFDKAVPQIAPPAEDKRRQCTLSDVKYGPHERNTLDLWLVKSDKAAPLFVYIHGGGWRGGDKSALPPELLNLMLDSGVSVASINYRYSEIAKLPAPVHDAARAVQFLRSKAKEWNLNKDRIGAAGGSAGACTTLWLAYHDDLASPQSDDPVLRESSRICAGVGVSGQTSIDPEVIVPWVGEKVMLHGMIWRAVGATNQAEVKLRYAEYRELYHEFSPINHVSAGDPPVLLLYPTTTPLPAPDAGTAIHHGMFGVKLKQKADEAGTSCVLHYSDKPGQSSAEVSEFLLKHLKKP